MENTLDWNGNNDLCVHVIDFLSPLYDEEKILSRLESILKKGLLTPKQQGKRKNGYELTDDNVIDVWSPILHGDRSENPKEATSNIVKDVGTSVVLLLETKHEETGRYPHSISYEKPKVIGLILPRKYRALWMNDNFMESLYKLATTYNLHLLNEDLNPFNINEG